MVERTLRIFLDHGCQTFFIPLQKPETFTDPPTIPEDLKEALEEVDEIEKNQCIPDGTPKAELEDLFRSGIESNPWQTINPFLKMRFGTKTWHFKNGLNATLYGIWFAFETNTSAQDENAGMECYDRGYYYTTESFTDEEVATLADQKRKNEILSGGVSQYIPQKDSNVNHHYDFEIPNPKSGKKFPFENLKFSYIIIARNGATCDVDVILDLGNTRTSGLLFNHQQDLNDFDPKYFRQYFKILKLKPDPFSGEYDIRDDDQEPEDAVEAGIASSWILLHELDHQIYMPLGDPKNRPEDVPPLLQREYRIKEVIPGVEANWKNLWRATPDVVKGDVCCRVPQMFTQLSPVLIGDQAERYFNLPYCSEMIITHGARVQQSSPKRYYWDDTLVKDRFWNMLLNEWDKSYPKPPSEIPTVQGEMFRFIREDGTVCDLSEADTGPSVVGRAASDETGDPESQSETTNKPKVPSAKPTKYPSPPIFPRKSTLTWMLLHILERAYAQVNMTPEAEQNHIPHRLAKVLITYPSGWTNDEVKRYQEVCKGAISIFSQANIYSKSSVKMELVPQNQTPDEAVAGQLPFIFSEIIRYPGQSASDWMSLAGKQRKLLDENGKETGEVQNTVRVMNFDIGGGTTDISVIEYRNLNKEKTINQNVLSTMLLFKDGRALAGDDILKGVIENIILRGLIKISTPQVGRKIVDYFSNPVSEAKKEIIRSRIVRTCLIPLATKCLSASGEQMVNLSARDAGVNENNWKEFCKEVANDPTCFSYEDQLVHFKPEDLNKIVEKLGVLFKNCADYVAAYDVDMLIFSGKPSELPVIRTMAKKYIPIDAGRVIFARDYKPGDWYPFTDSEGNIKDAKTVTVVGAALYYALSSRKIANWVIHEEECRHVERNEWGQMDQRDDQEPFLPKDKDEQTVTVMPNLIIARRQNKRSSQEPVYKFIRTKTEGPDQVAVTFVRKVENNVESLAIKDIDNVPYDPETSDYKLILWPCANTSKFSFWQETGKFDNLRQYLRT